MALLKIGGTGLLILVVLLAGCSSQLPNGDKTPYYDAAFNDHNRAPAQLSPPNSVDEHNSPVDPFFMRTQADYYFAKGEAQSYDGQHQQAIESFKTVLVYDQSSAQVHVRLAAEYVKMGMMSQALEQAEMAVKKNPKHVDGRLLLGGLYSALKSYDKALDQYEAILKRNPNNTEAPMYIGAIYAERKQYDRAVKYFESLAKNKDFESTHLAYYYIGRIRAEQEGKAYQKAAEQAFLKALSLKPNHVDSALALGSLYMKAHQEPRALELYRTFQREQGPNARIAEVLAHHYMEEEQYDLAYEQLEILEATADDDILNVKVKMALILIEQKKFKPAVQKLQEILQQVPESDKIRFYLAAVYEETTQYEKAVEQFRKIQPESQFYGEAVVHAAYLLKQQKNLSEALAVAKTGLEKRKDVPQLYAIYASLLDENKEYKTALSLLETGVKRFPEHVQLRFFLGTLQDRTGDKEAVIENMKKVVEMDPNHAQGLNYLAYTYCEMGQQLGEAEKFAKRALEIDPKDGFILDTYGWILFKQGRNDDAIRVLEKAHGVQPQESIIAEHLGDAYFKGHMVERARDMYEKAAQSEVDEGKVKEIRSKITAIDHQETLPGLERKPASMPQPLRSLPQR